MADKTRIEWTDATWNPVRGCTRVSAGCENCYAERLAARFSYPGGAYEGLATTVNGHPRWTNQVRTDPALLEMPLHWKQPKRVFVNSMSDLFHEQVAVEFIANLFAVMAVARTHTFQLLTKRPERMAALLADDRFQSLVDTSMGQRAEHHGWCDCELETWPLQNVWAGVSVEDQNAADTRIPQLLSTPAAVRFLSCEPLLGQVNLGHWLGLTGWHEQNLGIDWVIVGGESGPSARPMHPAWARSLRDQCVAAGVPFFFKQWGAWAPDFQSGQMPGQREQTYFQGASLTRWGKVLAGRTLDGRTWDEFPEPAR